MKKWLIMLVAVAICFASVTKQAWPIDGQNEKGQGMTFTDRTFIATSGDIRSILGPGGKSIAVSASGDAIAVLYGDPTTDPNDYMEIYVAYSLDGGASWTTYGPHSAELRRLYPGVDGSPDFDVNPGELYFEWQESPNGYAVGDLKCMIEENMPSAPSFSSPISMPQASGPDLCPWLGTVAVNIGDPFWVFTSGWSYLNGGNQAVYGWVSEDGGYTWTDTIRMLDPIDANGCSGHARFGTGDYLHYIYQDLKSVGGFDIVYPHYIESTDGGYTWSAPVEMPDVPLIDPENAQFWWHELDCEVINDEIWHVENDINQVNPTIAGFWVWHGTGSPGSWSWDVFNINDYEFGPTVIDDISYYFAPIQYGSVCHDPVSGVIAVTFLCYYETINTVTNDTIHDGYHVGALYSEDNGGSWTESAPLSTPDIGAQLINWNATETAHLLVNDGGVWAYTVWIEDVTFDTYFEIGELVPYTGVAEMNNDIVSYNFRVRPNITTNRCEAVFNMPVSGDVGVRLYDATGRLIEDVYKGTLAQGNQTINVNTADLATGTYFLVLDTEAGSSAQKIIKVH